MQMWKKSGAWFYRGMPNYIPPEKKGEGSCKYSRNRNGADATPAALAGRGWHTGELLDGRGTATTPFTLLQRTERYGLRPPITRQDRIT